MAETSLNLLNVFEVKDQHPSSPSTNYFYAKMWIMKFQDDEVNL